MIYPLAAPLCLTIAGAFIAAGTLSETAAPFAFTWGVPLSFAGLMVVMWSGDGLSYLMLLASALSIARSGCRTAAPPPDAFAAAACDAVLGLPPLALPLLSVVPPATLVARFGPDDPCLTAWLASTLVSLVPALPPDVQALAWQPGVVSSALIFFNAYCMLRTRRAKTAEAIPQSKKVS